MRLLLIRHAETTWNALGRIQGASDPPLSDLGREQAARLGARLGHVPLTGVYSSDLSRARETAAEITSRQAHGRPGRALPGLGEVGLGEWEGRNREELAAGWPKEYARWVNAPSWDIPPGGEGVAAFSARFDAAIAEVLSAEPPDGVVAVVTHIGCIRLALGRIFGLPVHGAWLVQNTSISTIDVPTGERLARSPLLTVLGVNDAAHLSDGAGW